MTFLLIFPLKSDVMKVCAISKQVLAIKSIRNHLTVLWVFLYFSANRTSDFANCQWTSFAV